MLLVSRIRSAVFSPPAEGIVLMRRSSFRPLTVQRMRPSWGMRRSEMSRFAMIFRREVMAAAMRAGGCIISKSTPSMRKRTLSVRSPGSMWMSLAPSLTAVWMM